MFYKKLNSAMNSIKKALLYINYKLFSNSLHGTHSPFVYKFLEDVVYNTNAIHSDTIYLNDQMNRSKKYNDLLIRMVDYFKISSVLSSKNLSVQEFKQTINSIDAINLLILNKAEFTYEIFEHSLSKVNECSIIVVEGIRSTDEHLNHWKKIQADQRAIVTIDLFEIGIVFFRTQQPKENFLIDY
jgi:hypothetical protein